MGARLGTTIQEVEDCADQAHVTLSDGTTSDADRVLLADGMRSPLRERLIAPETECLKPLGYRFAVYELPDRLGRGADFVSHTEPGHIAEY
jgi:2-polyprenyl-6-methoxyphenol hydroxylase-like FAD-dependent oxidoreductase